MKTRYANRRVGDGRGVDPIELPTFTCKRCGHNWVPRKATFPVRCAKCDSPYWNREPVK